jgi:hypothetical protein
MMRRRGKPLTSAGNRTKIRLPSSVLVSVLTGVYQAEEGLQIYCRATEINKESHVRPQVCGQNHMLEDLYKKALTTGRF